MSEQTLLHPISLATRGGMARRGMHWSTRAALVVVAALAVTALLGPGLAPHHPEAVDLSQQLAPASAAHWLGADHLGRDIFSRIVAGTRVSLGAVAASMALIITIGLIAGGTAAFAGGRVDQAIMRVTDVFLTFPTTVMALFMIGVLGAGLTNVIIAIVITHWAWYARMTRGIALSLRNRDFILAAKVAGASPVSIFIRHFMPALMAQLAILASLDIGHILLHISGLSFLGLGVTPPAAEWGVMMADARQFIWTDPMLMFWPGLALFTAVLACNTLGDALRDRLDPTLSREFAH